MLKYYLDVQTKVSFFFSYITDVKHIRLIISSIIDSNKDKQQQQQQQKAIIIVKKNINKNKIKVIFTPESVSLEKLGLM